MGVKYYNSGNSLGIIGCHPKHQDGEYTFIPGYLIPWIKTKDLYNTREEAEKAPVAKFFNSLGKNK